MVHVGKDTWMVPRLVYEFQPGREGGDINSSVWRMDVTAKTLWMEPETVHIIITGSRHCRVVLQCLLSVTCDVLGSHSQVQAPVAVHTDTKNNSTEIINYHMKHVTIHNTPIIINWTLLIPLHLVVAGCRWDITSVNRLSNAFKSEKKEHHNFTGEMSWINDGEQ